MNNDQDMREDQAAGQALDEIPASAPGESQAFRKDGVLRNEYNEKDEKLSTAAATSSVEATFHGVPLTISKCKFQAHIAVVSSVQRARAVSKAVSNEIAREAGFSEYVCPFAFRLSCNGAQKTSWKLEDSPRVAPRAYDDPTDDVAQEGFCDNGDIGAGEKLLYLLQKWDVRHAVLVVSRINGGFMMAELLGIRRYKFVVDRAKRLLESSDLLALPRRALDINLNPATTADDSINSRPLHEAAVHRRYDMTYRVPESHPEVQHDWDSFVFPVSTRQRESGETIDGSPIGRQADGSITAPSCKFLYGNRVRKTSGTKKIAEADILTNRTRQRRSFPLAQLNISSETVPFPQRYVPSVMGDKGYGVKRGRINHFEAPTPPSTPSCDDGAAAVEIAEGLDVGHDVSNDFDSGVVHCLTARIPGWSLPPGEGPTSATASLRRDGHKLSARGNTDGRAKRILHSGTLKHYEDRAGNDWNGLETTSFATTNSTTSQISAAMIGVCNGISKYHSLQPSPPSTNAAGQHHQNEGSKVSHRQLPEKPVAICEQFDRGLLRCLSSETMYDASLSRCREEPQHLTPPRVSLAIRGAPQAELSVPSSSSASAGGSHREDTVFANQVPSTLGTTKFHKINPGSRDGYGLPISCPQDSNNASGAQFPTIRKS